MSRETRVGVSSCVFLIFFVVVISLSLCNAGPLDYRLEGSDEIANFPFESRSPTNPEVKEWFKVLHKEKGSPCFVDLHTAAENNVGTHFSESTKMELRGDLDNGIDLIITKKLTYDREASVKGIPESYKCKYNTKLGNQGCSCESLQQPTDTETLVPVQPISGGESAIAAGNPEYEMQGGEASIDGI